MLKKNITLFLAGLGIAMMAPGQISASEPPSAGNDSSVSSDEVAARPEVDQAQIPATFEAAAGLWVDKGAAWYGGLSDTQKQGANGFYALIERGNDPSSDHLHWVKKSVEKFYATRDTHQFKAMPEFLGLMARMSDRHCAEFFSKFMECAPKGKLGADKYYVLGMRLFSQLPVAEQTLASMDSFKDLYSEECHGQLHQHNNKVRWRMIRDRLDKGDALTMQDVKAIFDQPRDLIHLAKGYVEKGPKEALVAAGGAAGVALLLPCMVIFGYPCGC